MTNIHAALGILSGLCLIGVHPACGNVISTIRTPPEQVIEDLSNSWFLHRLSLANLVATNCQIEGMKAGDAALIAGTAQAVASHMGLNAEEYFSAYLQPALQEIGASDACERHGDATRDIARKLKELGGTVIE